MFRLTRAFEAPVYRRNRALSSGGSFKHSFAPFQDYLSRGISVVVPRSSFEVQSQKSKYEKGLSDLFGAQITIQNVGIYNDTSPNA